MKDIKGSRPTACINQPRQTTTIAEQIFTTHTQGSSKDCTGSGHAEGLSRNGALFKDDEDTIANVPARNLLSDFQKEMGEMGHWTASAAPPRGQGRHQTHRMPRDKRIGCPGGSSVAEFRPTPTDVSAGNKDLSVQQSPHR